MAMDEPNDAATQDHAFEVSSREIELEILSNSWLSLTSSSGFDAMMESWARKIDALGNQTREAALVDQVVLRQFEPIDALLSSQTEFRHADPLERETRLTASPVMILSPDGTVAAAANGAEDFFRTALGRRAGRAWLDEESEADFDSLRRSILGRGNSGFAILRVIDPQGQETLAEAYGLEVEGYVGTFTVVRSIALDWRLGVSDRLEQAYGMTPSECEICRLVFQLRDLDEVAERRGVSIDTVRTQLKRIFGKLGVHSKAELVKLLAMICARVLADVDKTEMVWSDPIGRETIITRSDGRKLAYNWTGAQDGREVLFVHGEFPMFFLDPGTRQMLEAAKVKLVCLSMPGHGSSDPPPRNTSQLDDGLTAIEELLAHLGRSSIPCAASYSGLVYPMTLGGRSDRLVSAIVLIGLPWSLTPEVYKYLPTNQKTMSQLARRAPRVLDLVCRIGYNMVMREGPDFYLSRAYCGSPTDLRTACRADIQPYLRAGCRHLCAQGYSAFFREVLKGAKTNPAGLLAQLAVPLHWLFPRDATTWRAEFVEAAKGMSPHISVETVADAGELLPYQRPDVFVRALGDLASDDPATRFAEHDDLAALGRGTEPS
jgi:DNA-binding CsgD family transcriptional regulator/pimeloyl-ACP methyl ester carboxylesterase